MTGHPRCCAFVAALTAVLVAAVLSSTPASAGSAPDASAATVWLCHPDLEPADDPCRADLTTTVVHADGTTDVVETEPPAKRPPVDCFYVYPTVSSEPGPNADLVVGAEEIAVAQQQASRFSSVCRVYAPLYRQITIPALFNGQGRRADNLATAYLDVVDAWHDYMAHDNEGRGVVFIGHSQGTGMLARLLAEEVDPDAKLRGQVVSALLLGGFVIVPEGEDVGGTFEHLPACADRRDTGCVVAYSSFEETPSGDAFFGRVRAGGGGVLGLSIDTEGEVMCVNPTDPAGGTGALEPYFRTERFPGLLGAAEDDPVGDVDTPWVSYPDLYEARCKQADGASWLQVTDVGTPDDERPRVRDALGPQWGLHLVDVNLALGNLVRLVRTQSRAHASHE